VTDKVDAGDRESPLIHLQQLAFRWSKKQPWLLSIDELKIFRGERVFLYGPSGSGKSTLLNLLAGIAPPTNGKVVVMGQSLSALSARRRDRFRARHIGIVFQQFNLIPYLSVIDNVLLTAHFAGLNTTALREKALQLCSQLGLPESLLTQSASKTSVGQQQRIAVARALLTEPEIVIADEPTSALDSDSRDAFMALLLDTAQRVGSTVLFVSHDKSLQHFFSRQLSMEHFKPNNKTLAGEGTACC